MKVLLAILVLCLVSANPLVKAEEFEEVEPDIETETEDSAQPDSLETRVVNGKNAKYHAWPWQISLEKRGRHICGGSLINRRWVLTAAHCVQRDINPKAYKVTVGKHKMSTWWWGKPSVQQSFGVKKIMIHSSYRSSHKKYDVALLQLDGKVKTSKKVMIISLPPQGSRIAIGRTCYITGWGRLKRGGKTASILQEAPLKVASFGHCKNKNNRIETVDDKSMICAGGEGKGGCHGDSGGPFACMERGRWILRGVVSWGKPDCSVHHYTVFARVSSVKEWITRVFCSNAQCLNGGSKRCHGEGVSCRCRAGFYGNRCQHKRSWWGKRAAPAKNIEPELYDEQTADY